MCDLKLTESARSKIDQSIREIKVTTDFSLGKLCNTTMGAIQKVTEHMEPLEKKLGIVRIKKLFWM